ncbi:hypothetical protein LSTR_LSTR001809 [Laodelphax striatellus]|uniref:Uncharacterized protein n=1 Tax=Laodelphax striatellus TaxID=195883 RepID=A0A482WFM7_LAOST|nr:hypothetical protein LSTR_LSTR001809 [Laodelphax striatellus]
MHLTRTSRPDLKSDLTAERSAVCSISSISLTEIDGDEQSRTKKMKKLLFVVVVVSTRGCVCTKYVIRCNRTSSM